MPISGGNTKKQLQLIEDFGSTVLACTPSYAAFIGESLVEEKIDTRKIKLKAGVFGAEPWTEEMRAQIEKVLGIKAYDIYGLTEIIGPGLILCIFGIMLPARSTGHEVSIEPLRCNSSTWL